MAEDPASIMALSDYYDVVPNLGSCTEGTLKDTEKQKVLTAVNYIRKIHGLKPVTYNTAYDKKTAKAALIIAANEALDHTPASSVKCYSQDGYDGSSASNLYISYLYGSQYPTSESSINSWIIDNNVEPCGHRRWIIDPFLKYIAFGRADGASIKNPQFTVSGMTIWVISNEKDDLSGWDSNFVAYPYHDYPKSYYFDGQGKSWYMSFTAITDRSNYWNNQKVSYASATVEIKDAQGNAVSVSNLQNENDGYGVPNLIKWKANITADKKYYVTIKNVDMGGGVKKTFSYWFNVTDAPPAGDPPKSAPTLTSPANNATSIDINPTLTWNQLTDANTYNIDISEKSDFSSLTTSTTGVTLLLHKPNLGENIKYYWRVQGVNLYGTGPWSTVRNFTTKKLPYSQVQVINPAEGQTNVYEKTEFKWNAAGGQTYTLQVAPTDDFANPVVEEKGITDTTYHLTKQLVSSTNYFWRVRTVGMSGAGSWSVIRSFWSADYSGVTGDSEANRRLSIYPNPTDLQLNISYQTEGLENIELSVYNSIGQKVMDIENSWFGNGEYQKSVNINSLNEGTYFLRLSNGKHTTSKSFTKILK